MRHIYNTKLHNCIRYELNKQEFYLFLINTNIESTYMSIYEIKRNDIDFYFID